MLGAGGWKAVRGGKIQKSPEFLPFAGEGDVGDGCDEFKAGGGEGIFVWNAVGGGECLGLEEEEADAVAVETGGVGVGGVGDDAKPGAGKPEFGEGGIVFKKNADGGFVRGYLRKKGAGGELSLGVVRVAGELRGGGGAAGQL